MKVEVWGDLICSWTRLGIRRLENAVAEFDHAEDVEIVWRSFELHANAPREASRDRVAAQKDGITATREQKHVRGKEFEELAAREGLEFHMDRLRFGNTFNAHRLIQFARTRDMERVVRDRLMAGYFVEGEPIGDPETLLKLASDAGLDPTEAREVLDSDAYAAEVLADETVARAIGIATAPYFVIDKRFGVKGAQHTPFFLDALKKAWEAAPKASSAG
jgi:predicted DsbA family dithiol-disulfide isomerase